MAYTSGDVKLANAALALLAEEEIASFAEPADLAGKVEAIFAVTVPSLLASYPWRFTMTKQQLSLLTQAPVNEWTYQHALPPDMLVLRALRPSATATEATITAFEIFGRNVMSHNAAVWADYQKAIAVEFWPPVFYAMATHALASDLSNVVTGSTSLGEYHHGKAYGSPRENGNGGLMRIARGVDAQQQPPQRFRNFSLMQARQGGG